MRTIVKKIVGPVIQKFHKQWLKKPRRYGYKNISVLVEPGVFPPFLTLSTRILLDFINSIDISGRTFLELGCGSGVVSILAAKKGAIVTASDINQIALDSLQKNAAGNEVELTIVYSDLFANLKNQHFDYIVINPPYYPKNPQSVAEQAWFCGEKFEYFEMLFGQLRPYLTGETYLILSEDCEIESIKSVAAKNKIKFELALETKSAGERNFIFRLTLDGLSFTQGSI